SRGDTILAQSLTCGGTGSIVRRNHSMDPDPIRVISLCCNILGAFFLAKSITVKSPKYLLHELLRFKVNKSRVFRNHISQKLEGVIGFLFLFVGFALQIYLEVDALSDRETGKAPTGFTNWWLVIGGTVVAMFAIAWLLSRITRFFAGRIFSELVRFMVETHGYPMESDEGLVLELGKILRVRREEEDTVESYCKRVRAKMKVEGDAGQPRGKGRLAF
ncbi:MAG: hypothetical protein ACREID_10375, partial [Planctomycetota bacterium]